MQSKDGKGHEWYVYTINDKYIADYCNMTIQEVEDLNLIDFLIYRRDSMIYMLNQTEDGQEYLRNAWRIKEVAPDRDKLRHTFKKQ